MITNWSMLCASIEHITRNNTQFSEMVLDSWERPSYMDKTKEYMRFFCSCEYESLANTYFIQKNRSMIERFF